MFLDWRQGRPGNKAKQKQDPQKVQCACVVTIGLIYCGTDACCHDVCSACCVTDSSVTESYKQIPNYTW